MTKAKKNKVYSEVFELAVEAVASCLGMTKENVALQITQGNESLAESVKMSAFMILTQD